MDCFVCQQKRGVAFFSFEGSNFQGNFRNRVFLGGVKFPKEFLEMCARAKWCQREGWWVARASGERDFQYQTTLTLTHHLGPGALFTRARDVQTGLPGESEWRGSRLAQQRERCALHGGT